MYRPTYALSAVGGTDRELATQTLFEALLGLCRVNYVWRLARPDTPTLEQSAVVYKDDSRIVCSKGGGECRFVEDDWADWPRVLSLGFGDCDDLACAVVAEEWAAGRKAWPIPRCYKCAERHSCPLCLGKLLRPTSGDMWHVQVMKEQGVIVDPSRDRGMRPHPDGDAAVMRKPKKIKRSLVERLFAGSP